VFICLTKNENGNGTIAIVVDTLVLQLKL